MRNLILIILSVLVLVGCVEHVENPFLDQIDQETLNSHLVEQRDICYNKFDSLKSNSCVECDVDVTCNRVEDVIKKYAHYNHLCYIVDRDEQDMFYLDCETNIVVVPFNDDVL